MKNMRMTALIGVICAALLVTAVEAAASPADLRQKVDAALDQALAEHRIVGAVVLIDQDGKTVYQRAAGLADRELDRP
jgi:CubicO group peptidase (beta-lactamase class C family)